VEWEGEGDNKYYKLGCLTPQKPLRPVKTLFFVNF